MKKYTVRTFAILGAVLVATAIVLVAASLISQSVNRKEAEKLANTISSLIPQVNDGAPDGRHQTVMPALEIEGNDFCALLEAPGYNVKLPVCNNWHKGNINKFPHRFLGSMYDGSLVIGGSDNKGQMDFITVISNGDKVCITDVNGIRYTYQVSAVEKTKDVSSENLSGKSDLTLFARNSFGFDYTVVRCNIMK